MTQRISCSLIAVDVVGISVWVEEDGAAWNITCWYCYCSTYYWLAIGLLLAGYMPAVGLLLAGYGPAIGMLLACYRPAIGLLSAVHWLYIGRI